MSARYGIDSEDIPSRLLLVAVVVILAGCEVYATAPPCPFQVDPVRAPSAGCFTVENGKLLVVQHELGLFLQDLQGQGNGRQPTSADAAFGQAGSGDVDPRTRFEVQSAFFLAPSEFDKWEWRFEGQQEILLDLMERVTAPQQ